MALRPGEFVVSDVGGVKEIIGIDETDDRIWHRMEQDAQSVLDQQRATHSTKDAGRWSDGNGRHIAEIPMVIVLEMKEKHGIDLLTGQYESKDLRRVLDFYYPYLKTGM